MIDFLGGWHKNGINNLNNILSKNEIYSFKKNNFLYCESNVGSSANPNIINNRIIILLGNPVEKINFHKEWNKLYYLNLKDSAESILNFFNSVSGISGLIIHEIDTNYLIIITDPLGFIPIFLFENHSGFIYTNRISFLSEVIQAELKWDENSIANYYENGHFLSHKTWFQNTRRIKAATIFTHNLENNTVTERRYWSWKKIKPSPENYNNTMDSYISLFAKGVHSIDFSNQKAAIALSGGRDSRWIAWLLRNIPSIETFSFGIKNTLDLVISGKCAKLLNLNNHQYLLSYKNWLNDRMQSFINSDGLLSLEHFHEGNILMDLSNKYNIVISGFFGGYAPHYKKKRIDLKEAHKNFKFHHTNPEIQDSFYDFNSTHPYLIDQKMTNLAPIHLYFLSRHFKVATPFYNMEWISFLYSINKSFIDDQKLYLNALNSSMPSYLSNIPWQKTGVPLNWINTNLFILKFRLNDIFEKFLNRFNKTRNFYNYHILEKQIDIKIKDFQSNSLDFLKNYKPCNLGSKFRLLSILVWTSYITNRWKHEN